MSYEITYAEAIQRIAEKTYDNTRELRKSRLQRRTEFTDLHGVPFTAQGDATHPATFYISVSKDLVYYLRYQFKLHIQPMVSTVADVTGELSSIGSTSLETDVDMSIVNNTSTLDVAGDGVSPNPHRHSATGSIDSVGYGVTYIHTTSDNFSISIDGVDITDALIEQQDGDWIDGEGMYPSNRDKDETDYYDVLDVASLLYNSSDEDDWDDADKLLSAGFKEVQISSDAPFHVTMYLYLKYTTMGR